LICASLSSVLSTYSFSGEDFLLKGGDNENKKPSTGVDSFLAHKLFHY
jgi:hypothetical protein